MSGKPFQKTVSKPGQIQKTFDQAPPTGNRLANGHQFNCLKLEGKRVERALACVDSVKKKHIILIALKLKGVDLWHRFFLDAGLGFWEEWDESSAFEGMEDELLVNLAEKFDLSGRKVSHITCLGSYQELSSIEIALDEITLRYHYANPLDSESITILERI